ncbi:protein of unknown function [Hyphomicrobium sp. MC1]|nr:protein of unknown function [Hyphomicrobium sp. MC1]
MAHGINIPNAQPGSQGLATVNSIFTWVRLAQRVPVCIEIDKLPDGVIRAASILAGRIITNSRVIPSRGKL